MKNRKTTISGIIVAALMGVEPIVQNGDLDLKRDWLKLAIAAGIALFGLFTKDHTEDEEEKKPFDFDIQPPNQTIKPK